MAAKKLILVLDDDPSVRQMLEVLLTQDGHAVIAASDVRSALGQCAVQLPDLMVVDLMLPIEDGEMFLREFRQRFRQSNVPVILLSASTARGDIARRLQVEATLGKPFFADDLRELVSTLTRGREAVAAS